jgi:myo-inositol-1(or 4)-monophosphatase
MLDSTFEAPELDFVIDLAYRAGALLRAGLEREITIEHKGRIDFVTEVDRASEDLIVNALRARYPTHRIIAEEGGASENESHFTWLIDPLDGTTNYTHKFPFCAVSLGLLINDQLALGVVYDPFRDELFAAKKGQGARCNGRKIQVSPTPKLEQALISTGFAYDRATNPANNVAEFTRVVLRVQGIRRTGSAALDLCYVAAGRTDGHWEVGLQPWDTAAGACILTEAGGQFTNWQGQPWTPWQKRMVATNGSLHQELLAVLNG